MRAHEHDDLAGQPRSVAGLAPRVAVDQPAGAGPGYRAGSAQQLLALQRAAGNRAVRDLLCRTPQESPAEAAPPLPGRVTDRASTPASPVPVVQRGLRKGAGRGIYTSAPTSHKGKIIPPGMRVVLKRIIVSNEMHPVTGRDYSMPQAMAKAKREAAASPRLIAARPGVRFADVLQLRKYIKGRGGNTSLMKQKLIQHSKAYDSVLRSVAVVEGDFAHLKFTGSPQQIHTQFTQTFAATLPKLVRTSSAMDEICSDAGKGVIAFGSLKGAWFENWCRTHLGLGNTRVTIRQQGAMRRDRSSDAYNAATTTLWDMKNYPGHMDPATNDQQAADYALIVGNGYKTTTGSAVSQVNYIFPTQAAAQANVGLTNTYAFGVYYPSTGMIPALVQSS